MQIFKKNWLIFCFSLFSLETLIIGQNSPREDDKHFNLRAIEGKVRVQSHNLTKDWEMSFEFNISTISAALTNYDLSNSSIFFKDCNKSVQTSLSENKTDKSKVLVFKTMFEDIKSCYQPEYYPILDV